MKRAALVFCIFFIFFFGSGYGQTAEKPGAPVTTDTEKRNSLFKGFGYSFSVDQPRNWESLEDGRTVYFYPSEKKVNEVCVAVLAERHCQVASLGRITSTFIEKLTSPRSGHRLLEKTNCRIDNKDAVCLLLEKTTSSRALKKKVCLFYAQCTFYSIVYEALVPEFDRYLDQAQALIQSIKPEEKKGDAPAYLESQIMFYGGIAFLTLLAVGLLIFIYKIIPRTKKIRTCLAVDFSRAWQVVIPLPSAAINDIVLKPTMPAFVKLVNNFADEKKAPPSYEVYPLKLVFRIKHRRYVVEVSVDGWNFKGEESACRCLRNSQEVIEIINSLKEQQLRKK